MREETKVALSSRQASTCEGSVVVVVSRGSRRVRARGSGEGEWRREEGEAREGGKAGRAEEKKRRKRRRTLFNTSGYSFNNSLCSFGNA